MLTYKQKNEKKKRKSVKRKSQLCAWTVVMGEEMKARMKNRVFGNISVMKENNRKMFNDLRVKWYSMSEQVR